MITGILLLLLGIIMGAVGVAYHVRMIHKRGRLILLSLACLGIAAYLIFGIS